VDNSVPGGELDAVPPVVRLIDAAAHVAASASTATPDSLAFASAVDVLRVLAAAELTLVSDRGGREAREALAVIEAAVRAGRPVGG
jgi:predicted transcriptional regulator